MTQENNDNATGKQLVEVGRRGDTVLYAIGEDGVYDMANEVTEQYGTDVRHLYSDGLDEQVQPLPVMVNGKERLIIPYGPDNRLPYHVRELMAKNMVVEQCQQFNIMACYGRGLRFVERKTGKDATDREVRRWCMENSIHETFLEQCVDMKYNYWTVTVIVLSKDGKRIVQLRRKDSSHCRLEWPDAEGRIRNVYVGDWRWGVPQQLEVIPLLDRIDPLGDLTSRLAERNVASGETQRYASGGRTFALISRMATPLCFGYPLPYHLSIFRDDWYDIYKLIGLGKKYMIKNTSAPRIQIEIHQDYWATVCDNENILDEAKRAARIKQEKQNIIDFVCGPQNAGKAIITGYYIDPNGKEARMVRINNINEGSRKEGGDWADDMQEAANSLCFALGVHPNLIGATPGKSQMNNSGSDKRELFTLKQAVETPFHDVMAKPYHLVLRFNGWDNRLTVDVPMIELTTLDQNKSSQIVTSNNTLEK